MPAPGQKVAGASPGLAKLSEAPHIPTLLEGNSAAAVSSSRWEGFISLSVSSIMGHLSITTLRQLALGTLFIASSLHSPGQSTLALAQTSTSFRVNPTLPASVDVGKSLVPNVEDQNATDPQQACPGYRATSFQETNNSATAALALAGAACNVYGTDIQNLNLTVRYQSPERLNVEIIPANIQSGNQSYYILPESIVTKPGQQSYSANSTSELAFAWGNDPSFWFSVSRKSTGETLFSTKGNKLVFENQFVEFKSPLPKDYNLYGLGEVIHGLRLGTNLTRTFWANDQGDPIDGNIYGNHPIYIDTRYYSVDSSGNKTYVSTGENFTADASTNYTSSSHGVYLRNAHGQEVLLRDEGITWRTIGGSIDLYFYAGPSVPKIITDYQKSATGLPAMQQYWTLGFHQCRWGYQNWTVLEDVVNRYVEEDIPIEAIWADIDYMDQYRDFTTDPHAFPVEAGKEFLGRLNDGGRHFVPIVDSAIYAPNPTNDSDAYSVFESGNASDSFLKNADGSLYIGAVWPGYTVFPDWLSPNAVEWWTNASVNWYQDIKFSGIWIDMSEASSFCVGSCGSGKLGDNPVHPPFSLPGEPGAVIYDFPEGFNLTNATEASSAAAASSSQASALSASSTSTDSPAFTPTVTPDVRDVSYPPYVLNHAQTGHDLSVHAVSPNATHYDGTLEYDHHNLFGHQILNATYQALLKVFPSKRPFIIGRSTFAGSGKWAGHWGGDNYSKWAYMFFSIPQALTFSIFGIPMFGPDTCGFAGNSDEELCNRWMQLSAFFPFYRNHNTLSANSQEAYIWASVAQATRDAMHIRGLLLPYMYTLMYRAHSAGETVLRALAWEFPAEPALAAADRQFLLGPGVMVVPVLTPGATSVNGVFPGKEVWYDWYNQTAVTVPSGANVTIAAPLGHIPVYVRGGHILPLQGTAATTKLARQNPYALLVALSSNGTAHGHLYLDDGESVTPNATRIVSFSASTANRSLTVSSTGSYDSSQPLANITVLGLDSTAAPNSVSFAGKNITSWTYNSGAKVLLITGLQNHTSTGAWNGAEGYTVSW